MLSTQPLFTAEIIARSVSETIT